MIDSAFEGIPNEALFLQTFTVLEQLQHREPDPERADIVQRLGPVRNHLIHRHMHGSRPDPKDVDTALADVLEYLRRVEMTSLGTPEAQRVRQRAEPGVIVEALLRSTSPIRRHGFGPTPLRIALGSHLRRLREARGITREAAGYTIRGSGSKISRLELGRIAFKERDVADLLALYGVTDAEERQKLLTLVRQANAPGWWREYGDVLPSWFETYLGLERAASVICVYEPLSVPELLQTENYARAIIPLRHPHVSAGEIERHVALRMTRQAFLTQPGAPELWVILDEGTLRRPLGNQKLQRAQLLHLIEMAQRPNITLQVAPFDNGGHAAVSSSFTILRFSEPKLPEIVYLEHLTDATYLDKKRDTMHYLAMMDNLIFHAESPTSTVSFLHRVINEQS
jgi:transcriptional regulator with XRE-family HTH domain